jgi:hypothetical protein
MYRRSATNQTGESAVVGRRYLTRQAETFLKLGQAIRDPNVAAGLIEKAADLKSQIGETTRPDTSPQAPDVEPENRVLATAQRGVGPTIPR